MRFNRAPLFFSKKKKPARRGRIGGPKGTALFVNSKSSAAGIDPTLRFILGLVAVAALASLIIYGFILGGRIMGRSLFANNPDYQIAHIETRSDGALKSDQLLNFANLEPGENLFGFKLAEIRDRLEKEPIIKSARVRRQLPDRLFIEVKERVPIARLGRATNKINLLLDVDGVIIGKTFDAKHLPFIVGVITRDKGLGDSIGDSRAGDALEALSIYLEQRLDRYMDIRSIGVGHPDYLDVRLQTGTRIKLPRDQMKAGLDHAVASLEKAREVGRVVALIDLLPSVDNPIITYL
ncbi:MAG: cell division septal protein FtsQ [Kiritimatiellia bacterium]|jgi:cell division septal protein FtsQ